MIIPATPGIKFVMLVREPRGEACAHVENEIIAWQISEDGVVPIVNSGPRRVHDSTFYLFPDGSVEKAGSYVPYESIKDLENDHRVLAEPD